MFALYERLVFGKLAQGTMISEIASPNIVRVLFKCGFHFIIIDCEHGAFDYSQVSALIAVAKGIGLAVLVRLSDNRRPGVLKYMDMGADGLLLPMTNCPEDIAQVVREAKYPPLGKRGVSTMRSHNEYGCGDFHQYMEQANTKTMIFAQIETRRALDCLDEICAVEGVAGMIVGPNDLSMDLGCFGDFDSLPFRNAMKQVADVSSRHHKPWGVISSKPDFLNACKKQGMTICSCSSELSMIRDTGSVLVKKISQ